MEWYVDDSWTINLANGQVHRESYSNEREEYLKDPVKTLGSVRTKGEDIVMIEIRGNALSLWIDNKEVGHDAFVDRELNGPLVHVVADFDTVDGESIHYYGYDELPINEPIYKPAVVAGRPIAPQRPAPAQ